ncbi:MAG: Fic family protein [Nitrospinae bacterium]|nr:Fic family protein [Nitrospinota bacterium]
MEPLLPSEVSQVKLDDLVIELVAKASELTGCLNPIVRESIGKLVRSMNCYYSNLIEGHNTHPHDIDDALADKYSHDSEKRNLQKEAVAHIAVQELIDTDEAPDAHPASKEFMLWVHKEFSSRLPKELLEVENPKTGKILQVVPGRFRENDVIVGRHVPPSHMELDCFLDHFTEVFTSPRLTKRQGVIAVAAAHHRLLWIHPFLDGNGRVTRFMSHAMLLRLGIGSSLWSVSRGLARKVGKYKELLMAADASRYNDLDGRGSLSEKALLEFCAFFLSICIDQIEYMTSMIQPTELLRRIELYVNDEMTARRLPKGSFPLLREALLAGEFERGRASEITGYKERAARKILSGLTQKGLLASKTPKSPVRLNFPINVVGRWFPLLYPHN